MTNTHLSASGNGFDLALAQHYEEQPTDWDYWVETGMVAEVQREAAAERDEWARTDDAMYAIATAGLLEVAPRPACPVDDGPF